MNKYNMKNLTQFITERSTRLIDRLTDCCHAFMDLIDTGNPSIEELDIDEAIYRVLKDLHNEYFRDYKGEQKELVAGIKKFLDEVK